MGSFNEEAPKQSKTMYIEITHEAFRALCPQDAKPASVDNGEIRTRYEYTAKGVKLLQIDNYIAGCSQFYIQDINAWPLQPALEAIL